MAETTVQEAPEEKNKIFKLEDKNEQLVKQVDQLFFDWYDDKYHLKRRDEKFSPDASLDKLTNIVKLLRGTVARFSREKEVAEFGTQFDEFIAGDSNAAINILKNRPKEDAISKIMWLINVTTSVAVLSNELKEPEPLKKGPLSKRNVTHQNIEQVVVPIPNSSEMASPSKFLGTVLPKTFAAVAKHSHLAKAAEKRSAFMGNEYHNIATMDTIYRDLGEAMIFVSTDFFAEADRALTENGRRLSADKAKMYDFSKLSAKEQDKMMQTMAAAFRKFSNYTAELNMFSNVNDKLILDSVLCAYYSYLDDNMRANCGFSENQLRSLPNALAFARKYPNEYSTAYTRYSNKLVDGMTEAIKKEQTAVKKEWFENKITGEKVFRRGRLAGHGNKFMHTAPMEWLNKKLSEKRWFSLWIIPKLAMTTLKIMTNPTLHKLRKKLTGTLFSALRAFARGVRESFDKTGRSTEITYEDVIRKLKEATNSLRKIEHEKTVIQKENAEFAEDLQLILEADELFTKSGDNLADEANVTAIDMISDEQAEKLIKSLQKCHDKYSAAMSDEALDKDREVYSSFAKQLDDVIKNEKVIAYVDNATDDHVELANQLRNEIDAFNSEYAEFIAASKDRENLDASNAAPKTDSNNTLQVGEQSVKICEDVYDTLNKYIARQWNLLALHSTHADMPLCARYTTIDMKELVTNAGPTNQQKTESVINAAKLTLTEWLALQEESEAYKKADRDATNKELQKNVLGQTSTELAADRAGRDNRAAANNNTMQDTATYPKKYNDMYRYHGIELQAANNSQSNGFGVFAERLVKIAQPVKEFLEFVEQLGNESAQKTFDNSSKDQPVNAAESYINPYDLLINEDIANKIFTKADKAADKVGDLAKKPITALGKGVGTALGKLAHGITHTGTADKNQTIAKTVDTITKQDKNGNDIDIKFELTYTYSNKLRLSYLKDGANIIANNCLTNSACAEFRKIATLADALGAANFANAFSIAAVAEALQKFSDAVKNTAFKPCKSILSYKVANMITNGSLTDGANPDFGVIKGLFVSNYEAAREYSRELTGRETQRFTPTNPISVQTSSPAQLDAKDYAEKMSKLPANAKVFTPEQWQDLDYETKLQWVKSGRAYSSDGDKLTDATAKTAKEETAKHDKAQAVKQAKADFAKKSREEVGKPEFAESVDISALSDMYKTINNINWKDYL